MDFIDESERQQAVMLEARIKEARKPQNALTKKGVCHYCNEKTPELFCDKDCADDFEKYVRRRP